MMNAAHDEPATLQRSQRLREHPLRHSGYAAPQFRVSLRTPLKKHEKRDRPFVREQLDDSPRAGNPDQRFHRAAGPPGPPGTPHPQRGMAAAPSAVAPGCELITARRDPHSM